MPDIVINVTTTDGELLGRFTVKETDLTDTANESGLRWSIGDEVLEQLPVSYTRPRP